MTVRKLADQIVNNPVTLNEFLDGKNVVTSDTIQDMFSENAGTKVRK